MSDAISRRVRMDVDDLQARTVGEFDCMDTGCAVWLPEWLSLVGHVPPAPPWRCFTPDEETYKGKYLAGWQTDIHQVLVEVMEAEVDGWPRMFWLSLKRRDREVFRDWRVLQKIKSDLMGPEAEGVELYPAESRKVDTSNQFHLFVLVGQKWPFGWKDRMVVGPETAISLGAVQRPLTGGVEV